MYHMFVGFSAQLQNDKYVHTQWRTWHPGQEADSAPLFLIFFTKISKMEMVDTKLISVIFKSEKQKKKLIFIHFLKALHRVYTTIQAPTYIICLHFAFCVNRPTHSCTPTLTSLWQRCANWLVRFI